MREYLHGIISDPAKNISPTAENLERHFGRDSDAFLAGNLTLKEAYEAHRNDPTVAVKRRLWQDLLQVALGKDAATAGDDSDWLPGTATLRYTIPMPSGRPGKGAMTEEVALG